LLLDSCGGGVDVCRDNRASAVTDTHTFGDSNAHARPAADELAVGDRHLLLEVCLNLNVDKFAFLDDQVLRLDLGQASGVRACDRNPAPDLVELRAERDRRAAGCCLK
jgi:hypothetical protein